LALALVVYESSPGQCADELSTLHVTAQALSRNVIFICLFTRLPQRDLRVVTFYSVRGTVLLLITSGIRFIHCFFWFRYGQPKQC